jgi:CheY-like chemotaxis protein
MPFAGCSRILVVDDHQDAAVMLGDFLEAMGNTIRIAHDGPSALQIAQEFHPQLVLVDIGLPAMDGYEVARRLREQAHDQELHVVAITGYARDEAREQQTQAGFDAHLVKPVRAEKLERVLQELCTC